MCFKWSEDQACLNPGGRRDENVVGNKGDGMKPLLSSVGDVLFQTVLSTRDTQLQQPVQMQLRHRQIEVL